MRNSVIHGNRTLTRKSVTSSSLRSSSFPQWASNHHHQQPEQQASLSVVAGASAAAPLTSLSSSPSTSSQPLQLHQQQQDRWYRRKSAAAATIAGHHHPKRGGGSGGGSGHGGRRHPVTPNSNSSSSSRDKMNHASSSLNTRARPRAVVETMNVPFAYRAQQPQEQDPKQNHHHHHHHDNTRRSPQQQHQQHQPQSYQDTSRFPRHQQPNFHRNGSRFPSSSSSSSSSSHFIGKNNRGGGGAKAAAAAAAAKSDAMMKREQQEQEKQQIKQHKAKIQQTESEVGKLVQQDLVKLANQYRSIVNSTLSDSDNDDDDDNRKTLLDPKHAWNNSSSSFALNHCHDDPARVANSLIRTIQETLDDIHQTGNMMEWSQIQETENLFRQVCTLLQETVRRACHVHPVATSLSTTVLATSARSSPNRASHDPAAATIRKSRHGHAIISADDEEDEEEQDAVDDDELGKDWMDVAACCLHQLDVLRTERTLMVEATRKWKSERPSKQVEKNDVDSSSSSSFKGWASSLFPSFVNSDKTMAPAATSARRSSLALLFGTENSPQDNEGNQEEQQQHPRKEYVFMAHEDISLGPTQGLFRLAIESIASTIPQRQQQIQLPQQQSQPLLSPSRLDELPESSVLDPPGMAAADETYRRALQPIATRLVQLLDLVPTDSTPDLTNVKTVLEITSLVGSLESARQCSRIFDTATSSSLPLSSPFHGSSAEHADLIPFTLVLRSYLEAAKYEKDKNKRILVAQEVAKLLGVMWNRQLPHHKVKRIAQATIVLHCIAIVMARASSSSSSLTSETISCFCSDADNVFRRAVSNAVYDKFRNSILARDVSSLLSVFPPNGSVPTTSFAAIDYRILPLVNYLVRILALSGNADNASTEDDYDGFRRLEQAKRMICKMVADCIHNDNSNFNKTMQHSTEDEASSSTRRYMTLYLDVETVNAVIQGMVNRHRERLQHQQDKKQLVIHDSLMQDDLMVATKLLDFSTSRNEVGIWPNDETFGGMSALLTVLKPSNVGERLENLLDQMETRRYFSHRLMPITISLSVYNRVLWGLWQEALLNKTEPRGTSQRALTLLERLEMRSTPLWMCDDMVRKLQYSIAPSSSNLLYDLGLTPTKRTYELVLNACASTKAPSEFEKAALAAAEVVERMRQKGMTDRSSVVSSTLRTCGDRLPHDSNTRLYIESLLMAIDGNGEEDASESEKRVACHV